MAMALSALGIVLGVMLGLVCGIVLLQLYTVHLQSFAMVQPSHQIQRSQGGARQEQNAA
jgi:hypothetical protein